MRPEDLELTLALEPAPVGALEVLVNGERPAPVSRAPDTLVFRVPSRLLFRGDNRVTVATPRFERVRLREVRYRALRAAAGT
jgi:hypothetical protein